jgi:hypothetical protein
MTHERYLEEHHELSRAGLTEIALMLGNGRTEDATTATTNLRAMLDALWDRRQVAAAREVAP